MFVLLKTCIYYTIHNKYKYIHILYKAGVHITGNFVTLIKCFLMRWNLFNARFGHRWEILHQKLNCSQLFLADRPVTPAKIPPCLGCLGHGKSVIWPIKQSVKCLVLRPLRAEEEKTEISKNKKWNRTFTFQLHCNAYVNTSRWLISPLFYTVNAKHKFPFPVWISHDFPLIRTTYLWISVKCCCPQKPDGTMIY